MGGTLRRVAIIKIDRGGGGAPQQKGVGVRGKERKRSGWRSTVEV